MKHRLIEFARQWELKAKTGHGHATLRKMDEQAEELGLYRVERCQDDQGRQRLRFGAQPQNAP